MVYRFSEPFRCIRRTLLALAMTILAVQSGAAGETVSGLALGKALPEHQVVRCLFNEGRAVVRFRDKLQVVRAGDALPDSDARVVEISPQRMAIVQGLLVADGDKQNEEVTGTMLVIIRGPEGRLQLVEISGHPDDPPDRVTGVAMRRSPETTPGSEPQPGAAVSISLQEDNR